MNWDWSGAEELVIPQKNSKKVFPEKALSKQCDKAFFHS